MIKLSTLTGAAVCLTTLLLPFTPLSASQLNWDNFTGASFTSANNYTSNFTVDGMMVTVAVGGATANLVPTVNGGTTQSPAVTADLEGGTNPVENSLVIGGDFNNTTQFLSVTVTFKTLGGALLPVSGVNFNLYDIDLGGTTGAANTYTWVDRISGLKGTLGANAGINPATVTGTAGGNTVLNNVITGSGNIANTGTTSNGGNAFVSFGAQPVTSFTFNYGAAATAEGPNNAAVSQADPVRQVFALHDINFVPEPGTTTLMAGSGLLAGVVFLRRRRFQGR